MSLEVPIPGERAMVLRGPMADELGFHLRCAQLAAFRHFAQAVGAEGGITPGLYGMLQAIGSNPGLSQSALAVAMDVDRSSIVKVVDRLEEKGLIVRDTSPTDRRRYRLHMTPTGAQALQRIEDAVTRQDRAFSARLDDAERATLIDLLTRLYQPDRETSTARAGLGAES